MQPIGAKMNHYQQIREILDGVFTQGLSSQIDLPEERVISVDEAFREILEILDAYDITTTYVLGEPFLINRRENED